MAQMVKNLPAMQETQVQSVGWEDPLEKEMSTHSSILAWRIPWTEGAWQATVHGVTESLTRLTDYTVSSQAWQERSCFKSTHLVTMRGIFRSQMGGRGMTGCTLVAAKEKGPLSRSVSFLLLLSDVLLCQHGHRATGLPSRQRTRHSRLLHGSCGCLDLC